MPKVRIVFDRVRAEEKMLEQKAIEMGHDTKMIDAKITKINTESKKNNFDFGDVVIERCVSYFRGLHFTACLEFLDVPVINKFEVANNCGNKMLTSLLLKKHKVPTPKTYFSFSSVAALETLDEEGYPLVIKPVIGSWGRGVMALKDRETADAIVEVRELSDGPLDRIYYLQEMVRRPPRDIRAITVGDQLIAAMYRTSTSPCFLSSMTSMPKIPPATALDALMQISSSSLVISHAIGSAPRAMFVLKPPVEVLYMAAIN